MSRLPSLLPQQTKLFPGGEWSPVREEWVVVRVVAGIVYWIEGQTTQELGTGAVAIVPPALAGRVRSTRLGPAELEHFSVDPSVFGGLLTPGERGALERLSHAGSAGPRFLGPEDPLARRLAEHRSIAATTLLGARCRLIEWWAECLGGELNPAAAPALADADARRRFREFLRQLPEAELADCSITQLARRVCCSERHASRLFREEFGISFRVKQTRLRLERASRLLATSDAKVITIALESGYRHLGLFNALFKRHFRMTPTEWRNRSARPSRNGAPRGLLPPGRPAAALMTFLLAFLGFHLRGQEPASADSRASARPPQLTFAVSRYQVTGNTLLPPEIVDRVFSNALGPAVSLDQIRQGVAHLQLSYRERGFPTVAVSLPPQQLTNAVVQVLVTEGRLADIQVTGNRFFSAANVRRALPSLSTNTILNSHVFQRELDAANANRDRQIYPIIGPGPEPGTSALTLKVKDRLPVHGRLELNNQATPGTPDLRLNLAGQYNNLWQLEHQLGFQYSFTPEGLKHGDEYTKTFLDEPLIANYSGFYRLPLLGVQPVERQVGGGSGRFGFNEVTRQFELPPPSGRPEVIAYASRSTTDTGTQLGPRTLVTQTSFITIESQDSGEDLSVTENLGVRLLAPVSTDPKARVNASFGLDFKSYQAVSYNTNNFYISTVITNSQGSQTIESTLSSPQPARHSGVDYLPFNLGLDFSFADRWGNTAASVSAVVNLAALSGDQDFPRTAYSPSASAGFSTVQLALSREQKLPGDWSLWLRANGQLADGPLISNEQFGLGGTSGVRGYQEGEAYGDEGWRLLGDVRTPLYNLGLVDGRSPLWVRLSLFMDVGQIGLLDPPAGRADSLTMWGTGAAFTLSIGQNFDARLTVAWPLRDTPQTRAGQPRAYFGVGAQF